MKVRECGSRPRLLASLVDECRGLCGISLLGLYFQVWRRRCHSACDAHKHPRISHSHMAAGARSITPNSKGEAVVLSLVLPRSGTDVVQSSLTLRASLHMTSFHFQHQRSGENVRCMNTDPRKTNVVRAPYNMIKLLSRLYRVTLHISQ